MRRINRRTRDRERMSPIGICTLCGLELYPGQRYLRAWGCTVCGSCLVRLLAGEKREEVLG